MTSNVDKIYREYGFLEKIFPIKNTTQIKVQRWDDWLLQTTPQMWEEGPTAYRFYLLDRRGQIIARVGERWRIFTRSETVRQALARIGEDCARVFYAVADQDSAVILFKLPPMYTDAADWLKRK